jgi:hypothetical protein
MRRSVGSALFVALLHAAAFAACGDDAGEGASRANDGGMDHEQAGQRAAAGAAGVSGGAAADSGSAGRGDAGARTAAEVPCGATTCQPLPGGFPTACCADELTGTCGTSSVGGRCTARANDARCPSLDFADILVLPSCCTSRGMCGIDSSSVGGTGCVDLETAAERAKLFGASAAFPSPRACDEADAGDHDDAGR